MTAGIGTTSSTKAPAQRLRHDGGRRRLRQRHLRAADRGCDRDAWMPSSTTAKPARATSSTDIENATGGSGNDVFSGTANDNDLSGGAGADTIDGLPPTTRSTAAPATTRSPAARQRPHLRRRRGRHGPRRPGNDVLDAGAGYGHARLLGVTAALTVSLPRPRLRTRSERASTRSPPSRTSSAAPAQTRSAGNENRTSSPATPAPTDHRRRWQRRINGDLGIDTVDYSPFGAPVTVTLAPATG